MKISQSCQTCQIMMKIYWKNPLSYFTTFEITKNKKENNEQYY